MREQLIAANEHANEHDAENDPYTAHPAIADGVITRKDEP